MRASVAGEMVRTEARSGAAAQLKADVAELNLVEAQCTIAATLKSEGALTEAVLHLQAALRAWPGDRRVRAAVIDCLGDLQLTHAANALRSDLVGILESADLDLQPLAYPLACLARACPAFAALEALATDGSAERSLADWVEAGLGELASDRLFLATLETVVLRDRALEQLLTALRRALLRKWSCCCRAIIDEQLLSLLCALARQCFLDEYAWFVSEEEAGLLPSLAERAQSADIGEGDRAVNLALFACYAPLIGLGDLGAWPRHEGIAGLVKQQVRDVEVERRLALAIPSAGNIRDPVSKLVRDQYENNPYPRWLGCGGALEAERVADMLQRLVPEAVPAHRLPNGPIEILCAGCGTGQQVIEKALAIPDAHVLGVDLSLGSLGYAKRRALDLGAVAAEFLHADILNLGRLERRFDLIESIGVLHHLAEPKEGLRSLSALLKPGGLMRIGLYSRKARAGIASAQALLRNQGYRATTESMRACRRHLLDLPPDSTLGSMTRIVDFYSLSEFRDLLFHANEHRFSLPEVAAMIAELGLTFIGFELPAEVVREYRQLFGGAADLRCLECWDRFEEAHPDTFLGLYRFWLQAPG